MTVPANTMSTTKCLRVHLGGTWTQNVTNAGFTLRVKFGATTLWDSGAVNVTKSANTSAFLSLFELCNTTASWASSF